MSIASGYRNMTNSFGKGTSPYVAPVNDRLARRLKLNRNGEIISETLSGDNVSPARSKELITNTTGVLTDVVFGAVQLPELTGIEIVDWFIGNEITAPAQNAIG